MTCFSTESEWIGIFIFPPGSRNEGTVVFCLIINKRLLLVDQNAMNKYSQLAYNMYNKDVSQKYVLQIILFLSYIYVIPGSLLFIIFHWLVSIVANWIRKTSKSSKYRINLAYVHNETYCMNIICYVLDRKCHSSRL